MYIHGLDPTLLRIGFLEIRWYGLVYVLGFLLVYWLIYRKSKELGVKREQVDNVVLFLLVGLLVGARIFHFIFSNPSALISDPLEIFKIWNGGMSFFGALVGCFITAGWYIKKIKLDWKKFADIIVIGATIALILGRIANFINGELIGTVSELPWCVVFPSFDLACRHPYQIYAALSHVVLLFGLLVVNKIREYEKLRDGIVFAGFLIGYSVLRFITDFWRIDMRIFGITVWQYISIVVAVGGLLWMFNQKLYKKQNKKKK